MVEYVPFPRYFRGGFNCGEVYDRGRQSPPVCLDSAFLELGQAAFGRAHLWRLTG